MSYEKGVVYKLSIKLLATGVVTTGVGIVFMIIMMSSFDNLINLTYISLTSFLFGAGLSQLFIAIFLRFRAGKNPYQREETHQESTEEIPDYSKNL